MAPLWLAFIGLPVGLVLDAIARRLAASSVSTGMVQVAGGAGTRPASPLGAGSSALDEGSHAWVGRMLIVTVTAALFATAGVRFEGTGHLALVTAYICVLFLCATTDIVSLRVPNVVTYPAMLGAMVVGAAMPGVSMANVLAGGAVAGCLLLLPALVTRGVGVGIGDAKLAAFVGLALGLRNVMPALLLMALFGGAVAALLLLTGARRPNEPIPYAPFITAGALLVLLWRGPVFVQAG